MTQTTGADLCRVTVIGPQRRVDISLPADVPFAQLFPAILHYSGTNLADAGLAHGGWVLQRLDEAPFDGATTPLLARLRDGEVLYLRPGMSQLPEPSFDDVADVVATGVNDRPDRWRLEWTRLFALGTGAGVSLVAALILLLSGPRWVVPAATAGVIALLLLVAAVSLSRAAGDAGAGAVLGYAALPHAFLAGLLAPARDTDLADLGAEHLLAGFAAVVLVAAVAAIGVAEGVPPFLGAGGAALMGVAGTGAALAFDGLSAPGISAVVVTVMLALTPLIPTIAFRLARVTLPPVPSSADELRRDVLSVDGRLVLRRTVRADKLVTSMAMALGSVGLVTQIPLAFTDGWLGPITSGTVALVLLLRSRLFRGRTQRLVLLVPGMGGLALLAVAGSLGESQAHVLAASVVPLLAGAAIVVAVGVWLPGGRPSPFWGRAADVIDFVVVLALLPLALGEAGLFSYVRGLAG